jgi:hypothetical protein
MLKIFGDGSTTEIESFNIGTSDYDDMTNILSDNVIVVGGSSGTLKFISLTGGTYVFCSVGCLGCTANMNPNTCTSPC